MIDIDKAGLLEEIARQRWFARRPARSVSLRILDRAELTEDWPRLVLCIVEIAFSEGPPDLYHLPLLVDQDGHARDAFEDVDRLAAIGGFLAHGTSIKGERGIFHFGGPGLDPLSPPGGPVRRVGAEQTNTSAILADQVILKLFRRLELGSNPDLEITRTLTNAGFLHIPPHVGEITYEGRIDGGDVTIDLGIAQSFVTDVSEGWDATIRHLNRLYEEADSADAREDVRFLTEERASDILAAITDLGEVTGALHVALSREEDELLPEPIEPGDIKEWKDHARSYLTRLIAEGVTEIGQLEEPIAERIEDLSGVAEPGLKTRIHGDYHLGQVLHSSRGWLILDFEGEPVRTLEQRRVKHSPLKDVAGMLRSFAYASLVTLFDRAEPGSAEWKRLEPWAETWETLAREKFVAAYLRRSHESKFLPTEREELGVMLAFFELDKALYEVAYDRAHRPDWVPIPLRGIRRLLEHGRRWP